jgi:hypothetical protein
MAGVPTKPPTMANPRFGLVFIFSFGTNSASAFG